MTKAELRKTYLAKQLSLLPVECADKSQRIADNFLVNFDLSKFSFLHCYISIERFNEIDTAPLFERLWKEFPNVETVVPRVNFQTGEMESLKYTAGTELVQNAWKIYEPSHSNFVETRDIDMVLVPGVYFDKRGHRVGYGKGFYDKFLSTCRKDCTKVGLGYFEPVEDLISDIGEFDVTLDFCITPTKIHTTQHGRKELFADESG